MTVSKGFFLFIFFLRVYNHQAQKMGQKAYPSRSHPDLTRMNSCAKKVMNLGELEKLCLKHTDGVDSA